MPLLRPRPVTVKPAWFRPLKNEPIETKKRRCSWDRFSIRAKSPMHSSSAGIVTISRRIGWNSRSVREVLNVSPAERLLLLVELLRETAGAGFGVGSGVLGFRHGCPNLPGDVCVLGLKLAE